MSVNSVANALADLGIDIRVLQALAPLTQGAPVSTAPTATETTPGLVKRAVATPVASGSVLVTDFNGLLQNLQDAGIMSLPNEF